MDEQGTTLRVHGATTTEVLKVLVAELPTVVRMRVDGGLVAEGVWIVDRLETREDGVVVLEGRCARGCVFVRSWPSAWTCYQRSADAGVGFESIHVSRGDDLLWAFAQMPSGELLAERGEALLARDELTDGLTFESFCQRHLPGVAVALGEAAVLLSETDTAAPGTLPEPAPFRHFPREDDELDF